ncbi:MAG: histidine kinase N-terminal 7TM domain-containing protein [Clostridiales bacterium]
MIYIKIISIILLIIIIYYVKKIKNKKQVQILFIVFCISIIMWIFSSILISFYKEYIIELLGIFFIPILYIHYFFTPVFFLLFAISFSKSDQKINKKFFLLFIFPVLTFIIACTNSFHHFYYNSEALVFVGSEFKNLGFYGKYIHVTYSYLFVFIGIILIIYCAIENSGLFSKQSILIAIGSSFVLITNIIRLFFIVTFPIDTSISFLILIICFYFAIFKYDCLNLLPIATKIILNNITNSYIIIDTHFSIVDFNESFKDILLSYVELKRKDNFFKQINNSIFDKELFLKKINEAKKYNSKVFFRYNLKDNNNNTYYSIEIIPIKLICYAISFKNITEEVKNDIRIKEIERFSTMGHLIGGISHNLKSSIMTISAGTNELRDLAIEYEESIKDKSVTNDDHHEIAMDMIKKIDNLMIPQCLYISNVISSIRNQLIQSSINENSFSMDELIKRIDMLINYKLKKHKFILQKDIEIDPETIIEGNVADLIQIINNLILNAIQAYGKAGEKIILKLRNKNDNLIISVIDNAGGIKKEIQKQIFNKMITSKGKYGTGLGLYISYVIASAKLNGEIWFKTIIGEGTTFNISIPRKK